MTGLDWRKAPIGLREALSFTRSRVVELDRLLRAAEGVEGCVLLSTCNRTELYLSCASGAEPEPGALLCAAAGLGTHLLLGGGAPVGCTQEDLADTRAVMAVQASVSGSTDAQSGAAADKVVYLTFDDGPSATTESVLDTLKAEGVPATFFVMAADNNEEYLPLLERTVQEGHLIALHTCSHDYKSIYKSPDAYWDDLQKLREKLLPYVPADQEIKWLRFPGGSTNTISHRYGGSDIMKKLKADAESRGFTYVDWNVCAEDSLGGHPSASTIYNNIIREVGDKNTCVVLMHDTNATKNTAAALPDVIRWFKNAGYRFDTVDHLEKKI